ncbi:MAG TPA: PAS domain-containing protein [Hypericibacter adhaerens]|uniref:PAS domain-containing protein n=1 Tax=Hypericibacter adhaerens TaxID=2602016 RepID=UPI001781FC85|nr:PAS domain-containing protein [Hypericibacter adhaerens]HWA46410.1 PAS domain-containing protein [Hypericibacter adhaerens]
MPSVAPAVAMFQETDIRDPRLKALHAYWKGKAGARRMPARRDLDPIEMKEWLGNLVLVEFPTGRFIEFRYRLEGTRIEEFYGHDARRTGRGVEAMTADSERKAVLPQWEIVFDEGRPAYYESDILSSEGKLARQAKLLLPLSDDGEHVNMILGAIYFRPRLELQR